MVNSRYQEQNYSVGGLNSMCVKDINIDGANAYSIKSSQPLPGNSRTFDAGKQDEFLKKRAEEVRHNKQQFLHNQLRAAAQAGGYSF